MSAASSPVSSPSLTVYGLLLLTPLMIATGQVLFKRTSQKLVADGAAFHTVLLNPVFILALVIYGSATLLWIYVLKSTPLAFAYSFMALTFIIVPLMSVMWLGETVSLRYALGAALIVAGLIVVQT